MKLKSDGYVFVIMWLFLATGTHPSCAQQAASQKAASQQATSPQATASAGGFGGGYSSLRPQQKRLIDDWFRRFSAVVQKPVDPAEGYEKLPLSTKTTFNAVTHALLMTKLTNGSGKSLGEPAIELVDKIDGVAGQIQGARGDEQFRIYVEMKPGVLNLLKQTKEFKRGLDNTVYHKGYPICFRSTGGTPSIQISFTRDTARADIDVDYRSSKFPVFLVNGHLTASNSDVRAGDNDARHNSQWAGLQNWWRNLLGLPLLERPQTANAAEGKLIAHEPKLKDAKPADAIYDFLNSWLVEQKPNEAVGYFAEQTYACMEPEKKKKVDRGVVTFQILRAMQSINDRMGKIASLSDVAVGVELIGERLKVIEQPHHSEFVLYDVREDLTEEFNCANRLDSTQVSAKAMKSKAFGKYVGAVFRLEGKNQTGEVVATLWQNDHGYWKMISYEVDPQYDRSRVPNVGTQAVTTAPLTYVNGDKGMIKASSDFLTQWLVKKNTDKALDYIASQCLACVNLYRADDTPAPSTPEESRDLLKRAMTRAATAVGAVKSLDDAIVAPEPNHEDLKLVKHGNAKAFVIASIPEYMAEAADCERRKPDEDAGYVSAPATGYGKYYANGFSINEGKEDPGVLWIVWGKVNGSWKAVSFVLLTP